LETPPKAKEKEKPLIKRKKTKSLLHSRNFSFFKKKKETSNLTKNQWGERGKKGKK